MKDYSDIINLNHHVSNKHKRMPQIARAAQFAPFAALSGYEDAVIETARITTRRIYLSEEEKSIINEKLNIIDKNISNRPQVTLTYFIQDKKKEGGSYISITGNVRKIDPISNQIILVDNKKINILDLINISGI